MNRYTYHQQVKSCWQLQSQFIYSFTQMRALFICICICFTLNGFAQADSSRTQVLVLAGVGAIEIYYAGAEINFPYKMYVQAGLGMGTSNPGHNHLWSIHNHTGFYFSSRPDSRFRFGVQLNTTYWHFSNTYNLFESVAFCPALRLNIRARRWQRLYMDLRAGYGYNAVLKYERKTFEEVGWPVQWLPTLSIQFKYRLQ